jgi:nicotinamide-nucleotide amidase
VVTLLAELISIGTELLLGEIIDSNAAFLAQQLKARGVALHWKTVVGDNLGRACEALERALGRADLVIVGGGLGPTDDDLTREAIAAVVGETPVIDEGYLAQLRAFFESRGRHMPAQNSKQAWLLPSSEALANPIGTAPGWLVRPASHPGKMIVALPGPPTEMKRMWREQLLGRIAWPVAGFYSRTLRTIAIGESHVTELLGALTQAANPSVATYARRDGVHVRIAASAPSQDLASVLAAPVIEQVEASLSRYIYGYDDDSLAQVVGNLLKANTQSVAAIESLTGGLLLDELTGIAGASAYVVGGAVTYTDQMKVQFGVNPATIAAHGAISRETALEMAEAARSRFGSTWGLATTGVAGPDPSEGKAVGTVYIAIAGPMGSHASELKLIGERRTIKERTVFALLGLLWRNLRGEAQ